MRPLLIAFVAIGLAAGLRAQDEPVYTVGNGVSAPTVVKKVDPLYTSEARDQRIEGKVGLSCVVRKDGHVTDVTVTQSLDSVFGLDKNAVEAMKQWEFKPATRDNQPVAVKVAVQMTFTLK